MSNGLEFIPIGQKVDFPHLHHCSTSKTSFMLWVLLCHQQRKTYTLPLLKKPLRSTNEMSTEGPLGIKNKDFKKETELAMAQKIWIQIFQNSALF